MQVDGRRLRRSHRAGAVDLSTRVGSITLPNPVMTASGTSGHGAELAPYMDLGALGAVVVKSLSPEPWAGNRAPRVHETAGGMLNAVGLQGPGVATWLTEDLPSLLATGARVVASIWGRSVAEYGRAATLLADAPPEVVAVEVNLSCPNVEARADIFAHSASATEDVMSATAACRRPRWAKLSPNVTDVTAIAAAAARGGAEAVTLVNTVLGMAIDPAIHPLAVRMVHDVSEALPGLPIIGVGGVTDAETAVELLVAGASAVQVGTATFENPRAAAIISRRVVDWCGRHGVRDVGDLIGAIHDQRV